MHINILLDLKEQIFLNVSLWFLKLKSWHSYSERHEKIYSFVIRKIKRLSMMRMSGNNLTANIHSLSCYLFIHKITFFWCHRLMSFFFLRKLNNFFLICLCLEETKKIFTQLWALYCWRRWKKKFARKKIKNIIEKLFNERNFERLLLRIIYRGYLMWVNCLE